MPTVYAELRRMAGGLWAGQNPGDTLQPTALIHEAYLKLAKSGTKIQSRAHFFALAATAMRHVLINRAEANLAQKRGGGRAVVPESKCLDVLSEAQTTLELNEALKRLEALEPRYSRVVELRFFGGFGWDDIAAALEVSSKTVTRDWRAARAWLARELRPGQESGL